MKIAFTGHRPNKLGGYDNTKNKHSWFVSELDNYLHPEIVANLDCLSFISGMALGVDQWAAEYAIAHGIPFDAYVPFLGQEKAWPTDSQKHFAYLISKARTIKFCSDPGYSVWKMQVRNEMMADACDMLFAVWDGTDGGTANCIRYAEFINKPITRINPSK